MKEWLVVGVEVRNDTSKRWIVDGPDYGTQKFSVVCKSDYDKLKEENAILRESLEDCVHTLENSKCDEPEWARSSIELGKKILKDVGL